MRVGFYTPNFPGMTGEGGIGSYTQLLSQALATRGHDVHVLTPGDRPSATDGPVRIHFTRTDHVPGLDRLVPGAGACWQVARALRRMVRRHRLDVVELSNWEGCGVLFLRGRRPPVVVRLSTSSKETQEIDGGPPTRVRRWDVRRERWQAHMADVVVTHSEVHRRLMADELGMPADRIRLIPLGVEVFPTWVRPPRPPGPPTVVYLGRLEHRKGTIELLQSVPRVLRAVPDAHFVLIGTDRSHCPGGRTHAAYLEQEFSPSVRQRVTLAGRLPQPQVDHWLQTADLFVAPSRYESFGLIFAEAMRWGTPVIGTTAGGIPEIVEDGKSGILIPPENPVDLADAIIRLLSDRDRCRTLGEAGRRRVEQEFSVDRLARREEALYQEVIDRGRGRRRTGSHHANHPGGVSCR